MHTVTMIRLAAVVFALAVACSVRIDALAPALIGIIPALFAAILSLTLIMLVRKLL